MESPTYPLRQEWQLVHGITYYGWSDNDLIAGDTIGPTQTLTRISSKWFWYHIIKWTLNLIQPHKTGSLYISECKSHLINRFYEIELDLKSVHFEIIILLWYFWLNFWLYLMKKWCNRMDKRILVNDTLCRLLRFIRYSVTSMDVKRFFLRDIYKNFINYK